MSRYPHLSVAVLATALLLTATAHADDPKDVKPIATIKDISHSARMGPFEIKRHGMAVRNAEELVALTSKAKSATDPKIQKQMEAELAKLLKVEAIDWSKQMVVGVIGREVDSIKTDGKVLTVNYTPYKEPLQLAIPPTPKHLMLIERVEGEVKFVLKFEKKDKE